VEVTEPDDNSKRRNGLDDSVAPIRIRSDRNMSDTEMVGISTAGTVLTVGVLYTLAMSGEDVGNPASLESLEVAGLNIVDAGIGTGPSAMVAVAIGEAVAGVIGAGASFGISRSMMQWRKSLSTSGSVSYGVKVSDAVADGDFLLTNAAATPLFEAIGLSPLLASLTATSLAIVPYGIVKAGAQRRERMRQEDKLMEQLLAEEQERERRDRIRFGKLTDLNMKWNTAVDPNSLTPVQEERFKLDWVEAFSDIIRWLQFDILKSDFGGHLTWQGHALFPGAECAIFGCVTALTSQGYADALHGYFRFGGESKQAMVLSRTLPDWAALYLSKLVYYAVLFGVYDAMQGPAAAVVAALGSGGVDACVGSNDYASCIETFVTNNPPGASAEAELRSLITAGVSLWNNYGIPSWTL
jgi:hypothetical protein